jgi:hypothetical protein
MNDSYIVTVIVIDTGEAHVMAEWECAETDAALYAKAANTVSSMVRKLGTVGVVVNVQLTAA